MRDLTIIIPNFNSLHLLQANLPRVAVAAGRYPGRCRVLVVDDASTAPGFGDILAANPTARGIQRAENGGFSAAIATGVAAADTELMFLLNSDVAPDPECLAPLAAAFDESALFAASPVIRSETGDVELTSFNRYAFAGGKLRRQRTEASAAEDTPFSLFASGGSMMVRRRMYRSLGGFHPLYAPYYFEDLDLCLRAWRRGWTTRLIRASSVVHQHVGSIAENVDRDQVRAVKHRNRMLIEWVHFSAPRLLCRLPLLLTQIVGRALKLDRCYLAGLGQAVRRLPQARRLRRAAGSERTFDEVLARVNDT